MDKLTPEQRRRSMQAVKNKNSLFEFSLGKALWAKGTDAVRMIKEYSVNWILHSRSTE